MVKKWKNIKDNYLKSLKKKTKSGQAADSGRRYIYARQLTFLQTAGATIETQSSLEGNEEEEDVQQPEKNPSEPEGSAEQPQRYNQNRSRKRKRDLESSLIDFLQAPIPSSNVVAVPEPNADRSFFESILPSISDFTEDQKLEFRCEILNLIKRMRKSSRPQNYGYPPHIPYETPNVTVPTYPTPHSSSLSQAPPHRPSPPHSSYYLPRTQSQQSSTQLTELRTRKISSLHYNPVSPSDSSSTSIGNQSYIEEDGLDIFIT